ncbi:hypothetical protein l13_09020 [Neisseria weaveri ATCC 51223]|nr:hypothetical protein l13_09020 [Neisseria weaveri ATCC 51223]
MGIISVLRQNAKPVAYELCGGRFLLLKHLRLLENRRAGLAKAV